MSVTIATPAEIAEFTGCTSRSDLAVVLGTTLPRLEYHLYSRKAQCYHVFRIPKANGSKREIQVPPPLLRLWQRRLLTLLSALYTPKRGTHGFVAGRSTVSNAAQHEGRALVLNIDLLDFFPSIHFGRVRGVFEKAPFSFPVDVASVLAQLCTYNGKLPQGAPTSPILSNLVCRRLDNDFRALTSSAWPRCDYTRYSDDITISTRARHFSAGIVAHENVLTDRIELGEALVTLVERHDFRINESKTRLRRRGARQEVTGLVVNERVNVPRQYVKQLRAILNDWKTKGEKVAEARLHAKDALRKTRSGSPPTLRNHIHGKLSFLRMVRQVDDPIYVKYALAFNRLSGSPIIVPLGSRSSSIIEFLKEAVWIVVGKDGAGNDVACGTAITLKDVGIVTARHVFTHTIGEAATWRIIRSVPPFAEFPICSYKAWPESTHPELDLAVVQPPEAVGATFVAASNDVVHGDSIWLVGFPNWNSIADEPMRSSANVSQVKITSGVRHFSVDHSILAGLSGGAVLGSDGSVVGIVKTSKDHDGMPNAAISVKHVADLAKAPQNTL